MAACFEFDSERGEWLSSSSSSSSSSSKKLKIVTFNVWFGSYEQTKRCDALVNIVASQLSADVICLQEVTAMFLARLREHQTVRGQYRLVVPEAMPAYGVICLLRRSSCLLLNVEHSFYPTSSMQRSYLLCELAHVAFADRRIVVVNTHLESLQPSSAERVAQMQLLFQRLERFDKRRQSVAAAAATLLMGDFNFDPSWPEERSIPANRFVDCWLAAATSDEDRERREATGFTEDTYRNLMRFKAQGKHKQVRFDRVLLASTTATVETCSLIGTEPFENEIWPSDHFGLCATIDAGRSSSSSSSSSSSNRRRRSKASSRGNRNSSSSSNSTSK